jgi:beta-galactosidase
VVTNTSSAKAHVETALWLAHLRGMSANLGWYWSRGADGSIAGSSWFKGSLLQQPWMLQGYAQETLNLSRFVRPLLAFTQQPRPVRLLYSEACAIQDVSYLDALRDAYEALNFLGISIGVVTERQLAEAGLPADTRLVIVPNAQYVHDQTVSTLRAVADRGLVVGIIGERSLTSTPTGGRREEAQVPGAQRIALGTPQEYQQQFDAWSQRGGIERELVALDAAGRPAWGIELRTAREGGRRLAYLVNLMRQPIKITLRARAAEARLRDWRTDTDVANEVILAPRQLLFGSF